MNDLTTMLRDQAKAGLKAQLDKAVTDGNTEDAHKIMGEMEKLTLATAPKAPPYGDMEIRAALDKNPKFGTDPKWSAKAMEFGKTLNPKKFDTAEAFAAAVVKAVDDELKPPAAAPKPGEEDDENNDEENNDEGADGETDEDKEKKAAAARRRASDGPSEGDTGPGTRRRASTGPWVKLSDAPPAIQKEVNRTADKFAPKTEDGRKKFISKALESHYAAHQRAKGKK